MKTRKKYCAVAAIAAAIAWMLIAVGLYYDLSCPVFLIAIGVGCVGIALVVMGIHKGRAKPGDPLRSKTPVSLWLLTGLLTVSVLTACPASEVQAQTYHSGKPFPLSTGQGDYTLAPIKGGRTISFPRNSITVDSERMLLITPAGKFKIIPVSDKEVTLQAADGTLYKPDVTLCEFLLVLALMGAIVVAGCVVIKKIRSCHCLTNYQNRLSNAMNSSIVLSPVTKTVTANDSGTAWGTYALPGLTDLTTTGATHVMGPPPQVFNVPANWSFMFTNFDTNNFYGETPGYSTGSGGTDIFGNTVNWATLVVVGPSNLCLMDTNGQPHPCWLKTSADLQNWTNLTEADFSYAAVSGDPDLGNCVVQSLTTVAYTPDLTVAYATNFLRFDTNTEQIVESWYLRPVIGIPIDGPTEFLQLKY